MSNKNTLIKPENIIPKSAEDFDRIALDTFHYQYAANDLYRQYCNALRVDVGKINSITEIPFLPISLFKTHEIKTGNWSNADLVFQSSGTTGEVTSKHFVQDAALYERALLHGFQQYYGEPGQYTILALLPSYLERQNASLVYMAKTLMQQSGNTNNGFYINEWEQLTSQLKDAVATKQKVILLGVTFALLDFAASYPMPLEGIIVMETGGMKGRREEWTRKQVHEFLQQHWQLKNIHSEYGMTELLSQAYSVGNGIYHCTDTMKILVRDVNDPLEVTASGSGCINVIDLANIDSCAFIATEDLGIVATDGSFEILGRLDNSALRGCSLMTA